MQILFSIKVLLAIHLGKKTFICFCMSNYITFFYRLVNYISFSHLPSIKKNASEKKSTEHMLVQRTNFFRQTNNVDPHQTALLGAV